MDRQDSSSAFISNNIRNTLEDVSTAYYKYIITTNNLDSDTSNKIWKYNVHQQ